MQYRILAAESLHLDAVRHLLVAAALPLDGLTEQFPDAYAVAYRDSELVGVAGLEQYGSDGLLRSVAVTPSARGTGIGSALVAERLELARRLDLRTVYLLTTTAAAFFEQLGFSRSARDQVSGAMASSVEFAHACPASAICLSRGV